MVRFKNRYIISVVNTEPNINPANFAEEAIYRAVISQIQNLHGDFGVGAIRNGFYVKKIIQDSSLVIIRARHGPHKFASSALPFITKINNISASMHTIYIGSTIRNCYKFLISYNTRMTNKLINKYKDSSQFSSLLKSMGTI